MKLIPLSRGMFAQVNDDDYEQVSQFKWHVQKNRRRWYAVRNIYTAEGGRTLLRLHRFLLPGTTLIDHIDGNGLNNQRHNLRPATNAENCRARCRKKAGCSSRFRGVSWDKEKASFRAKICVDGKQINLGQFNFEKDAARAYNAAAIKHYGDFGSSNHI